MSLEVDEIMMDPAAAHDFRLQLQHARENTVKDAEAFGDVIHVVERLGSLLLGRIADLGKYKPKLEQLAMKSPFSSCVPMRCREYHTPFGMLYDIVREARNDALHVGAVARHLTKHVVELSLILEDALRRTGVPKTVSDFMIRDPVCAELWQPISHIRQRMLANSYTYLPILDAEQCWCLISDLDIAKYLLGGDTKTKLATPLKEAKIKLEPALCIECQVLVAETISRMDHRPVLVMSSSNNNRLLGILTATDVL